MVIDAHWKANPMSYQIKSMEVNKNSKISLRLAPGGGTAIALKAY